MARTVRSVRVWAVVLPVLFLAGVVYLNTVKAVGVASMTATTALAVNELTKSATGPIDIKAVDAQGDAKSDDVSVEDAPLKLASLDTVADTLSQLVISSVRPSQDARSAFADAEFLRVTPDPPQAIRGYIALMENFPDTPQAQAGDARIGYLIAQSSLAQFDAIEAQLPDAANLTNVDSITAVGYIYLMHALELADDDPARAQTYFAKVCELAWQVFQDKLDDPYKKTVIEAYLAAADAISQGEATRAALSQLANTIRPSYASWLIKTVIDENEPPFDFVTTFEGQAAVRDHYLETAQDASDPAVAAAYYAKTRDAAWQMEQAQPRDVPRLDLCNRYLAAAAGLGEPERETAVAAIEDQLATEPLSIMRWITRYELADFLVREGAPAPETRAGFQHFELLAAEGSGRFLDPFIGDESIDLATRGIVMCMLGHAYAGTNRVAEAELYYNWVLEYFPHETHPGASAAYSLAVLLYRKNVADPAQGVDAYEQFVADHPSSFYSALALMEVGKLRTREGDLTGASHTYERIKREYPNRSTARIAAARLDELALVQ